MLRPAVLLLPLHVALKLHILVATPWKNADRRTELRKAFASCGAVVPEHSVDHTFFLGWMPADEASRAAAAEELAANDDMVALPGHDTDPPVGRDVTYVLDRPTSRSFKTAFGSQWLVNHRKFDFVLYLDDDSFISLPRLFDALEGKGPRLSMGWLMNTPLDWSSLDISVCDVCSPCDACTNNEYLNNFCTQFDAGLSKVGCYAAIKNCQVMPPENKTLDECVRMVYEDNLRLSDYFGSKWAPTWLLGMGWVFGRDVVEYIAANVKYLKLRGAADVVLGFWLAGFEDVEWVDMGISASSAPRFHDYPRPGSTFSGGCTGNSILVHRMRIENYAELDHETCTLGCPEVAERVAGMIDEKPR